MTFVPFPHQVDLRAKLRVALRTSSSVLAFSPTGSGKTHLAAMLIFLLMKAGKRVIFCVHRDALIRQTAATFAEQNVPFSYVASGYHFNPYHRVFIASIPTLQNRLGKIPADYVFIDEAHLSASSGWSKTINHYKAAGAKIIGLTGSPERLDGKPLGDVWDAMVEGPSTRYLIENGFLSKYKAYAPAGVDLSGVSSRAGDYVTSQLDAIMEGKAILAGAVDHWKKYSSGLRTIAFASSVKSAEKLAEEFREAGVSAVALDGSTEKSDRRAAFEDFADRKLQVLVNCRLFTEGFDIAAQVGRNVVIESVLDYAPTQSLALHLQKHGRGLRRDSKPHILLDLVGGFSRLGLPDDEREWSLEGRKKVSRQVELVTCPTCFGDHHPAPKCPYCNHVYEKSAGGGGRQIEEVEHELEEIDVDAIRRERQAEQRRARTLEDLIALATARGYRSPEKWAGHIWTARKSKERAA